MKNTVKISIGLTMAFSVLGAGCSPSSPPPDAAPPIDLHALYASDVAGFAQIDSQLDTNSLREYDDNNNQLFTKIFGGLDAGSVEAYFQARIQYAFTEDDLQQATLIPASFPKEGWNSNPSVQPANPSSNIELGALNISTGLWLEGTVAGEQVTLTVNGQAIPITSTHTGIMLFGAGYKTTIADSQGNTYPLPPEYRQTILVHEARHSDCTGGLSEHEVELMRNATSANEFQKEVPLPHCGHSHVICPSGTYKGVPACDVEKYGAYTVGAVFMSALIDAQTDEVAHQILEMTALDYDSRFLGSAAQSPDEQEPNMTSGGLTP